MTCLRKKQPTKHNDNDHEYLRMKDVQHILKCSAAQCYRLANSGMIPTTRIGGIILVPRRELYKLLDKNTQGGDTHAA